mgnify:CR=1 FL=1
MQEKIYFDNAATTRVLPEVVDAMLPYFTEHFGNPSSIHSLGRKSRSVIEKARRLIAQQLNASTAEIFFTSGGTESNNTVLKGAVRDLGVTRLISSKLEHHCVLHTTQFLQQQGIEVAYVRNDSNGFFDLQQVEELLQETDQKTLVSLIHANNEIGTINDLHAIGSLCKKHGAYFHADTVQTVAHYQLDLENSPVDFISASAHKFHGPKGVGFLYVSADTQLQPFMHGGSQERNMRAGTENLAAIAGMAKAFEISYENLDRNKQHITSLKKYAINQLKEKFEGVGFNGDISDDSLYTVVNVAFPHTTASDMFMFNLDIRGICCSAGSACSSGADRGSHVIDALGKDDDTASIRFSFNGANTKEEIDRLMSVLEEIL